MKGRREESALATHCDRSRSKLPLRQAEDSDLLEALRSGHQDAFDSLYHRYFQRLYNFSYLRLRNHADAEEVVQEVMLKVFQHRDVFRYDPQRGRFRDWLAKLVRNQLAERRRRPSERVRARGGDSGGTGGGSKFRHQQRGVFLV